MISRRHYEMLLPFAEKFSQLEMMLRELTDEELEVLAEAAKSTTSANCWYHMYHAARWLDGAVAAQQGERRMDRRRAEGKTAP